MKMNPCGMHPMFALEVPAPFPAPHPGEVLPAGNISPTTFKTFRSPVLSQRRSVRSMRNLLPLTLPSSSNSSSNTPPSQPQPPQQEQPHDQPQTHVLYGYQAEHICLRTGIMTETAEPTMDCNLPELLAQDLEFSSLIFAAKNMTAGAPSPALASDEGDWHDSAEPPSIMGAPCHPNGVQQFQPLGAIEEKSSASGVSEHDISDASSSSSGDSFSMTGNDVDADDDAAESPQIRQQSVMTTDTTITAFSQSQTAGSHKRMISFGDEPEGSLESWMDFEPDAPADHPELGKSLAQSPVITPVKPVRPLSRLGNRSINESPPRAKTANPAATTRRLSNPFEGYTRPASRPRSVHIDSTTTTTTTAATREQNRHSIHSLHSLHSIDIAVPTRCSSLKHRVSFTDDARKVIASRSRSRSHTSSSSYYPPSDHVVAPGTDRSSIISDLKEELEPWFRCLDAEDDQILAPPLLVTPHTTSGSDSRAPPTARPRSQVKVRSRPTSSVSASYSWLEDPIDLPPPPSDDQSRRIPLPPNVMESLRVSVTCFPETMLLCSSLSIETIRTYSRKVRQPPEGLRPDTPPASPKRWKWLGQRRNNSAALNRRCCSHNSSPNLDISPTSPSAATLTPPQWSRLRSVFPHGSDYLCDALYAHIVAYNYLAPMIQSGLRPPTPGSPETTSSSMDESIPKKAASLLGLQGTQDMAPPPRPPPSLRKRSSMFLSLRGGQSRQSVLPPKPATPTPVSEVPLRDLQHGLSLCIARLVTTLSAEGSSAHVASEPSSEVNSFVMRSLCEIVKCCEESATNERPM